MKKITQLFTLCFCLLWLTPLWANHTTAQTAQIYSLRNEGILNEYYRVDTENGYICVSAGTDLQQLQRTCMPCNLTASSDTLATGTLLTAQDGDDSATLTVMVPGDLNGDGSITISDMLMIKSAVLGETLPSLAAVAADLNFDTAVSVTDFLKAKAFLLGLEEISSPSPQQSPFLMTPNSVCSLPTGAARWESGDVQTLSLENNQVTALQEGTAFLYGYDEKGTLIDRQMITVVKDPVTLSFGETSLQLALGQALQLTPKFNHPVSPTVSWQSSDPEILTVEQGLLTACNFGTVTVTASLENGNYAELSIIVAPPIELLDIERNLYKVKPQATKSLSLLMSPADNQEEILWESSDPSIATVDANGTVTGVAYGTVTITATGKYSGLSDQCQVKVCNVIQVALTFDDGPSQHTTRLLDCLQKNDIKVTFFLIGNQISSFKTAVQREAAEGHELGYHSYAHAMQTSLSSSQITSDFEKTDKILYDLTGKHFTLWRTPGGSYNSRVTSCVPLPHILWSADTLDWKTRNENAVYNDILRLAKDGAIILMHDLHGFTVNGAIRAIEEMVKGDYEFLTVTEMLSRDGTPPENCKTYFSGK